jgi:metallo-beta-lactamase family protein
VVLADAAKLQEEDARHANKIGSSRHKPALPLFTHVEAEAAIAQLQSIEFGETTSVAEDVTIRLHRAGHILGSSWVEVHIDGYGTLVLSGDFGRETHPLLLPPEPLCLTDSLIIESTYGDRIHPTSDPLEDIANAINGASARGGSIIIPSFAVDRTEVLLMHLNTLRETGRIPSIPIFLDSPMAIVALEVYREALRDSWPEMRPELSKDADVLGLEHLRICRTVEESKQINAVHVPSIIIAGSGMATGGRVLHHLADRLPKPQHTVLLVGYQVSGSRGQQLVDGAQELKIFGEYINVRAHIESIGGLSVHADQQELVHWVSRAAEPPSLTFVVHGEPDASEAFRSALRTAIDRRVVVARDQEMAFIGKPA